MKDNGNLKGEQEIVINNNNNPKATRTVLDFLAVAWGLLEGLDQESRGGRNNGNISLSVLYGQLDGDFETRPLLGGGSDIFTNLLGGLCG
jgi:hypothetical protein